MNCENISQRAKNTMKQVRIHYRLMKIFLMKTVAFITVLSIWVKIRGTGGIQLFLDGWKMMLDKEPIIIILIVWCLGFFPSDIDSIRGEITRIESGHEKKEEG
jgi:hypothetical protein